MTTSRVTFSVTPFRVSSVSALARVNPSRAEAWATVRALLTVSASAATLRRCASASNQRRSDKDLKSLHAPDSQFRRRAVLS
jgi:hypothetical protein